MVGALLQHLVFPDPAERSSFLLESVKHTCQYKRSSEQEMLLPQAAEQARRQRWSWERWRWGIWAPKPGIWIFGIWRFEEYRDTCSWLYWLTTELQGGSLFEVANNAFIFRRLASSSIVSCDHFFIINIFLISKILNFENIFPFYSTCPLVPRLLGGMVERMMIKYSTDRTGGRCYNQLRINQIDWRASYWYYEQNPAHHDITSSGR